MSEGITQIQKPTPEQLKPKEKLSDEEMGNLLSSVGNSEAKAITLILMRSGNVYDRQGLGREILQAQGKNRAWNIGPTAPLSYCSGTFSDTGFVVKEVFDSDLSIYGYAITKKGKELGISLAGLLLDFSERRNIPLSLLLSTAGSTSKKKTIQTGEGEEIEFKKRAPSTTLKILYELLTEPNLPVGQEDLGKRIGEDPPPAILGHLTRLSKLGLLEYKAIEANESYSYYKWSSKNPEGSLPSFGNSSGLTESIFAILKKHSDYLTIEDVYGALSEEQKSNWEEANLKSHISQTLAFFNRHGYANIKQFHQGKQSEVSITEEQRIILTEFLEIMYRFQNQDPEILEKGKLLAERIIANPQTVSNLMRRAKEASSQANRSPIEETQGNILAIISANPGITNKEIQTLLEQDYGKKLGINGISGLSFLLTDGGLVSVKKTGSVSRFYPGS